MAGSSTKLISLFMQCISVVQLGLLVSVTARGVQPLSYDYYKTSCPSVEGIVRKSLLPIFATDPTSPAAFLRLLFHDCQVEGCDASILLDSDSSEMISSRNFNIRNRESIGQIKSILEMACPGQVSCADIIALAARESVAYSGGPLVAISLGRKDSITSSNQEADAHLPSPAATVDNMIRIFTPMGMTIEESVAILGSHTVGVGHCINIVQRLYGKNQEEMDVGFEMLLRVKCPTRNPLTNLTFLVNDLTSLVFDNQYYRDLIGGRGLFTVDSRLPTDPRTAPVVAEFAMDQSYFFRVFSSALVKLSSAGAFTGGGGAGERDGEVRRECNRVNY